ncbi:MAG: DivIVA domain-containing protein, partial [Dermatophilaceae bacterium]
MALTPEQVLNRQFQTTQFRKGYDERDVDDFLDEIVTEMRSLISQREDFKAQLNDCRAGRGLEPVTESTAADSAKTHAELADAEKRLTDLRSEIDAARGERDRVRGEIEAAQAQLEAANSAQPAAAAAPAAAPEASPVVPGAAGGTSAAGIIELA